MKLLPLLFVVCLLTSSAYGERLLVAVASNFAETLKELSNEFEARTGHELALVRGSTGKLYAQIINGAPYDIFMAADNERPAMLEKAGRGVLQSRTIYAAGRLVLWSSNPKLIEGNDNALFNGGFNHLALANPKLAPYGRAASQVMENLQLSKQLQQKLVFGENISQTYQFVSTGNAELGFIAHSQLLARGSNSGSGSGKASFITPLTIKGSWWLIPADYHDPILQEMLILKDSSAATEFTTFLESEYAKQLIQQHGYNLP